MPRVALPWDQLVFLEQFEREEVLQAVDRAAALEVPLPFFLRSPSCASIGGFCATDDE